MANLHGYLHRNCVLAGKFSSPHPPAGHELIAKEATEGTREPHTFVRLYFSWAEQKRKHLWNGKWPNKISSSICIFGSFLTIHHRTPGNTGRSSQTNASAKWRTLASGHYRARGEFRASCLASIVILHIRRQCDDWSRALALALWERFCGMCMCMAVFGIVTHIQSIISFDCKQSPELHVSACVALL